MKSPQQQDHGGAKRKSSQDDLATTPSKRFRCDEDDEVYDKCYYQIKAQEEEQEQEQQLGEDEDCISSYSQVSTLTVDLKVGGDKVVEESTESKRVNPRQGEDEYDDVTTVTTVGMELDMEDIGSRADGDPDVHVTLAEDEYRYVLSSGRRTAPKEQAVVTIDDEFEQYFAQLMI